MGVLSTVVLVMSGVAAAPSEITTRPAGAATRTPGPQAPAVAARSAYLIDSAGTVHYAKRPARRAAVASLVKIMTTYVVLRETARTEAELTDLITVTKSDVRHAAANGATSAALRKGERLSVLDLLHGVMLPSGADASHALARRYGPGQSAFVAKMNAAARTLGLADTRYTNADGLPYSGYSTAADQARLTQAALGDAAFRAIAAKRVHRTGKHTWRTTNRLFARTDGVIGVKTGFTNAAGFCLAFAADRAGRRLVGVLLGDQDERRFRTAAALLDYAEDRLNG
ncbi:serine hydrolase [Nonomuraea sp. NPDC050310]|uniref:D-alanyl-D-alanine carboxypeptidase family protein n=1 Tax=unclassified Nonomuraea TaxID=2593643 RepID=UPI0033C4754C